MNPSPLNSEAIAAILAEQFGQEGPPILISAQHDVAQPWIQLSQHRLREVCTFLRDDPRLYFDFLECLSGIDLGPEDGKAGVVYHLMSIPHGHRIVLKCFISRHGHPDNTIPSVAPVWLSAD